MQVHRSNPLLATTLSLALTALGASAHAQGFQAKSLEDALQTAAANKSVVMIAVRMPGERMSDRIENAMKRDKQLTALSKVTANVLLEVGPEAEYAPEVKLIRERYLEIEPDEPIPAPLHLFVQPDGATGKLLHSTAFAVTTGELEWAWVDAIRQVQPDFPWEFSAGARAPARIRFSKAEPGIELFVAPSDDELETAMKEIKKSGGGGRRGGGAGRGLRQSLEHLRVIIRSPEKAAIKFGVTTMRSFGGRGFTAQILRAVGDYSPDPWSSVAEDLLEDRARDNREEAARALEQLHAPKTVKALSKQLKDEEDDLVRGRILRAMAAVNPADKSAIRTIEKAATKDKVDSVRMQAVAAAALLQDLEAVRSIVIAALGDSYPDVRSAAAWVAASRRDPELLGLVEDRAKTETSAETQELLKAAIDAVKQRQDLEAFDSFRKDTLGDRLQRRPLDANAFGGGGRGDGGGGTGGDDPGGGGREPGGGGRRGGS